MNTRLMLYGVIVLLCSVQGVYACDFTLTNDGNDTMVVVDPNNCQALVLAPGQEGQINPSIPGIRRYQNLVPDVWPIAWLRYPETLDIYLLQGNTVGSKRYQVTERYCASEANIFRLSELISYVKTPHPRLNVYEIVSYQPAAHHHDNGGHAH